MTPEKIQIGIKLQKILERRRRNIRKQRSFIELPDLRPGLYLHIRKENIIEFSCTEDEKSLNVRFMKSGKVTEIEYGIHPIDCYHFKLLSEDELRHLITELKTI
jgi:hypothetical protein